MSFNITDGIENEALSSTCISNKPENANIKNILNSNNINACKTCPFNKDYYVALNEQGYWKAQHNKAKEKLEELKKENKELKAKLRMREKQLFGKKSEKTKKSEKQTNSNKAKNQKRNRGQQPGKPGHGRGKHNKLEIIEETIELPEDEKFCKICGLPFASFPGTEDSDDIVVNVKAYKRRRKRKRYKKTCDCPETPGIIIAPLPPKLIKKGILDTTVWVRIILDKYHLYRPTNRLLKELNLYKADIPQGTVTDGLKKIAPLFDPILKKIEEGENL